MNSLKQYIAILMLSLILPASAALTGSPVFVTAALADVTVSEGDGQDPATTDDFELGDDDDADNAQKKADTCADVTDKTLRVSRC